MKYKVAIVDDHPLIIKAISSIVDGFADFAVCCECENGKVLQDKLLTSSEQPDIVMTDISMPLMDGYATAAWVTEKYPDIKIIALSIQDDDESLLKIIKAGAKGYMHKSIHPAELEKALHLLINNGVYYPNWASNLLFQRLNSNDQEEIILTDREKEFLKHSCSELTYKDIGEIMSCSPRTIDGYRDALFNKLGVKSRVALALYAVKTGLYKL